MAHFTLISGKVLVSNSGLFLVISCILMNSVLSGLDSSINFNRWNEADDEDLENTLNSTRSSSSPFSSLTPVRSQASTPPFSLGSPPSGIQRSQTDLTFTTSASQFIQLPPRMTNNTLVFTNSLSNQTQQIQFISDPLPKSSWQSQTGLLLQTQNLSETETMNGVDLSSSPLGDVMSSLPSQNLGVQNLTLPSTTLDLSDIKWGILEPTVTSIKRSGSTESQAQGDQTLSIQEGL